MVHAAFLFHAISFDQNYHVGVHLLGWKLFYKFHLSQRLQFPFLLCSSALLSLLKVLNIVLAAALVGKFCQISSEKSVSRSRSIIQFLTFVESLVQNCHLAEISLNSWTHLVQSFSVVFLYWFYSTKASMDSPYVSSYGSSLLQNSGSEEDLQALMDQKKRKRMISNRESARRSRMRKQKHLDGLTEQVNQLRKENGQSLAYLTLTTEQYFVMEAENSVLRTQMMELSNRLQYLNEILHCLNESSGLRHDGPWMNDSITNPWNLCMNHPITASADMLYY
ncbi:hypothetical protein ZIOFF_019970 [Zingiber officinale]|uniref:BZIP domain-containing protein n=2 Tax=Zingiber officinale TaxID=94328 RepID=A0A8J5H7P5_ZINOF|nr:hypothetical protein ZIOFF_019970 [Zingiber officinale]